MNTAQQKTKAWADRYIAQQGEIIGPLAWRFARIEVAPDIEDRIRNTDMTMTIGNLRISLRVRSVHYWRYNQEFTQRSSRPSGVDTELDKVRQGYGDLFLVCYAQDSENHPMPEGTPLLGHVVIDLDRFRAEEPGITPVQKECRDGSAGFNAYRLSDFSRKLIVDISGFNIHYPEARQQIIVSKAEPEPENPQLSFLGSMTEETGPSSWNA